MKLNFRSLAILTALASFALAITWMLAPNFLLSKWAVEFSYPVGLVGRRVGAMFAGIGVMFFLARNAEPSSARTALVAGFVVACLALAGLGVYELATSHASAGILSAVLVEILFPLAFLYVACTKKSAR